MDLGYQEVMGLSGGTGLSAGPGTFGEPGFSGLELEF